MKELLTEMDAVLKEHNASYYNQIGKPIEKNEIVGLLNNNSLYLCEDFIELYSRHGWVDRKAIYDGEFVEFCPLGCLFDLKSAIAMLNENKKSEIYKDRKLPIVENGFGDYLAVDLKEDSPTRGAVFIYQPSVTLSAKLVKMYDSVSLFIQSVMACYKQGAYVSENGSLDIDFDKESEISKPLNPQSIYWEDDIGEMLDALDSEGGVEIENLQEISTINDINTELENLKKTLTSINHPILKELGKPLGKEEIERLLSCVKNKKKNDLIALHQFCNWLDCSTLMGDGYVELASFGAFVGLGSVISIYYLIKLDKIMFKKLPIMTNNKGAFIVLDYDSKSKDYGKLLACRNGRLFFYMEAGDELVTIYDSITAFIKTIDTCYKVGAYQIEGNFLKIDKEKERETSKALNPESDYWKI